MKIDLNRLGTLSGYLGILVFATGVAGRFYREPEFIGHKAISILTVGIAFLVFGCWAKLEAGSGPPSDSQNSNNTSE